VTHQLDDKKADSVELKYDELMMPQPSPSPTQRLPSPFEHPYSNLVGNPPKFDGDRANAISFLNEFEMFMALNDNTQIGRDPTKRAVYFLNITKGPAITVKHWVDKKFNWLSGVMRNPDLLPEGMNAWDVLRADFERSFEDYLGPKMAGFKLQELRMKKDRVDDYIAEFEGLARSAGYGLNGPLTIRYFIRGLPRKLAKDCIDNSNPETFDKWAGAVREQLLASQQIKAYNKERNSQQLPNRGGTRRNGLPARQDIPPAGPRTTPCNSNASTTVVDTNRKVITELTKEDKENYRRKGLCFRCRKQGHISSCCPDRARTYNRSTTERM
jgi:Retrotransposon gag protein